jgi:hypothetical protein
MENKIRIELQKLYHTGDRVTNKELKKQIQLIYDRLGYKAKAKGTDIKKYGYSTHKVKINIDGKRYEGVELTKI